MKRPRTDRRGFAMLLVLVFLVILLSLWGVAYRRAATGLRLERARALAPPPVDQPNVIALARGLALLETGTPEGLPTWDAKSSSYSCGTNVAGADFTVTFRKLTSGNWAVQVRPGPTSTAMPDSFTPGSGGFTPEPEPAPPEHGPKDKDKPPKKHPSNGNGNGNGNGV
jgi:hypothetical protein